MRRQGENRNPRRPRSAGPRPIARTRTKIGRARLKNSDSPNTPVLRMLCAGLNYVHRHLHRDCHPVQKRRGGRNRPQPRDSTANQGRRGRHCTRRHHRRIADRGLRGAYQHHRAVGEVRAGQGQSARRHRRQCDERSDLSDAPRRRGRCGRFAPGRTVLQQTVAGGTVPAFPRHRARDETAHRALQHSRPLWC